jgi:hypothetical protein
MFSINFRSAGVIIPLVALAACQHPASPQEALMGKIESEIVLPIKSFPLEKYARYYARDRRGQIWGSYTPEADESYLKEVSQECRRIKKPGPNAREAPPFPCPLNVGPVRLVKAGQRLWMTDPREIPGASGGGCSFVTFIYDPKTSRFKNLQCNGDY